MKSTQFGLGFEQNCTNKLNCQSIILLLAKLTSLALILLGVGVTVTPLDELDRNKVKVLYKALIAKMQSVLVIDWRKKQRTKAHIQNLIEEVLDDLPDSFDDELLPKTCTEVFMHIYDKYPGDGQSAYN